MLRKLNIRLSRNLYTILVFYIILWGLNNCRKPSQKFICEPRKWFSFFLFSTIFFSFFRETTNTITPAFSMGVKILLFWALTTCSNSPNFFVLAPPPPCILFSDNTTTNVPYILQKAKEISLFWTSQNIKKRSHSDYKIQQKSPLPKFSNFSKNEKENF